MKTTTATVFVLWFACVAAQASVLTYNYRVLDSSATPTARVPRFYLADTAAELAAVVGAQEGDHGYARDTDRPYTFSGAAWTADAPATSGTALQAGNGSGGFAGYSGTSCTNQFPRSLSTAGAATCASVALGADVTGLLGAANGGTGTDSTAAAANRVFVTTGGAYLAKSLPSCQDTGGQHLNYNNSTQAFSCGTTGAPSVAVASDRTTSSTTAATTTDLTWSIAANAAQAVTCELATTNTATSLARFAVDGPAGMTLVSCLYTYSDTSLTAASAAQVQGQWASTCTNCTPAVTASVLTSVLASRLTCALLNGANAGSITIYMASSTAGQTVTLLAGSACQRFPG